MKRRSHRTASDNRRRGGVGGAPATLLFVCLLIALVLGLARRALAEPITIRVAGGVVPGVMTPVVMELKQQLTHYGKSYVTEVSYFRGSSPQIQALAAKQLDLGYLAFGSFPSAILNAKLDLEIVADFIQEGPEGHFSAVRAVRADSGITKVEDLRGKRIGIIAFGTGNDLGNRAMLKRHGLEFGKDYTMVEVQPPNMGAMLREGKIDLAWLTTPFWFIEERKGGLRKLFDGVDAMGPTQVLVMVGRKEFLAANKAAVQDFFEDYLRGLRYALDPKNREELLELVSRLGKRPKEAFASWVFTKRDYYRDRDGIPNIKALQANIDLLTEVGLIKTKFDVSRYVNLSYIKEAAGRLGKP
ncbi:MAG: ABC transporter substrate-binding protein [Candidatus Tectomicrobia bacterium]|nr:ABC transporter substrate-binding protein [Candidatus Tectomicrobia bacterium]